MALTIDEAFEQVGSMGRYQIRLVAIFGFCAFFVIGFQALLWDLVCDRSILQSVSSSSIFIGWLLGAIILSWVSDKTGRRYLAGRIIMAMLAKFFIMISFDSIYVYSAELLPTVVRFVNAQVYFGVSLGSVLLGGNMYLNFFLTSLIELPGNAFAIWSMDRFGRKLVVVVGLIVGAFGNMLVTVFPEDPENEGIMWYTCYAAGRIAFALLGKFAIMCSFDAIFVFSSELFPTVIRTIGIGSSSAAGRVGAISAPFVIWLARYFTQLPYIVMAVDALIAGFLCMLLPETNNAPTVETLQTGDSEQGLVTDLRPDKEGTGDEELKTEKEEDKLLDKKDTVV
ncbi:hypothetical protein QZH41_003255 [Actinostola sp. cb2023]|nr:hypothetical protein QZH41_003255 [Actinostola sp. cb2023]